MAAGTGTAPTKLRSRFKDDKELRVAMLDKLAASGLDESDAKKLHLQPYSADKVAKELPLPAFRAGFRIPYFDVSGKPTAFYRFRYLEYGTEFGFAALVADKVKQLRYVQPSDTINEIYAPPLIDWSIYAADPTKSIFITEGELKAACACKKGFPTLGLGGVWSFKSTKHNLPMLPMFDEFNWQGRRVYIVYDSDAVSNPMVVQAENALAAELLMLGAVPFILRLPQLPDGKKCGLDDYLMAHSDEEFMGSILSKAEEWAAARELYALNEEVCYVVDPGLVLRLDNLQRMSARAFIDHAFSTRKFHVQTVTAKGTKLETKSAPKEWIGWPFRSEVKRITYAPGAERVTGDGELNCWRGWGTHPVDGDVRPWRELLEYLFKDKVREREWFERWLAYPLQNPGEKLYTACVLWGIHHGTGKSLVGYTMFRIYGTNATEIGDKELYSTHNEWAENKQFVMGDEITGGDKRNTADRLKSMITQTQLRLNPKYVPSYTVPDCINYYFTSNHPDAFYLEGDDRRFFIHEVKGRPLAAEFYERYVAWLDAGGADSLFGHLLSLDMADFNPHGHAPFTNSKAEMIENGRSDIGTWVASLREDPDRVLRIGDVALPYSLWTTSDLFKLYDPEGRSKVTKNGMARELARAGFVKVYDGQGVRTESAGQQRLWAVRSNDKLLKLSGNELGRLYDTERSQNGHSPKKAKY